MAATIFLAVSGRCKCSRRDVGVRDYGCNGMSLCQQYGRCCRSCKSRCVGVSELL